VWRILGAVRNPIHRGCFSLIYGCGLWISEAAALRVTAIDKTSGVLRVVGKGNEERVVPVPKEVHEGLRRMWQAKDYRDRRWLFPNGWRTGPVATHVLTRTFAEAVKAANLPGGRRATPHTLRHAYATRLFEKKVDTSVVQVLLGHEDIGTTTIYTHPSLRRGRLVWGFDCQGVLWCQSRPNLRGGSIACNSSRSSSTIAWSFSASLELSRFCGRFSS
jgi:integrase/recombinase XerD